MHGFFFFFSQHSKPQTKKFTLKFSNLVLGIGPCDQICQHPNKMFRLATRKEKNIVQTR